MIASSMTDILELGDESSIFEWWERACSGKGLEDAFHTAPHAKLRNPDDTVILV